MQKIKRLNNKAITASSGFVAKNKKINIPTSTLSILPFWPFKASRPVVAVLRLEGIIGRAGSYSSGMSLASLNKKIEKAFKIKNLAAVCLAINSPGGSPVQSELIAKRIIDLSNEKKIPVYSFIEDVAASGGYWLACAGDKIYASRSSIVGSIGVISSSFGFTEAIKKLGIERRVYTSGNNKSVLDPFQTAKDRDIELIKKLQHNIHQHFIDHVKTQRGSAITQSDEIIYNAEFWTGQTALDYGLIDGLEDMYSFIQRKFKGSAKIEIISEKTPFFKRLFSMCISNQNITNIEDLPAKISAEFIEQLEGKIITDKFNFK